jgi:2'-5' RNA ligase
VIGCNATVIAQRAVIALTPKHVDVALAGMRRRWDPQYEHVPSHLTLVFPHRVEAATLLRHVEAIAATHQPIGVRLAGFAGSDDAYLFARVTEGNDTLITLHDDLYRGVLASALDRTSIFVPHVTVGRFASPAGLRAALDAADQHLTWQFDVRELTIYRLHGEQHGEIEASVRLADAGHSVPTPSV